MALILHSPKSHITSGTKVEIVARFLGTELQFNRIPNTQWKSPEHLKRHPLGKVPVLETPEGCIYESLAIVRYLARKAGKLYGNTPAETAQVDQWLEWNNTQLQPHISAIIYAIFGYIQTTQQKYDEAKKSFLQVLKIVDAHLAKNEYLSKELSVADLVIAVQLRYPFTLVLDESARSNLPNLTKWFLRIIELPINKQFFGKTWVCQKEFVPDFAFLNRKKEQPKKQAQKQQVKKEQKPKKVEEQEKPAAKKKNPLDLLPPTTFVMDDFKRDFVNAEDRAAAFQRFWAAYDPAGWSLWKSDYELAEGEGKVGYLTCNLKNGMVRNLDDFRKYAFGVLGTYGNQGDLVIKGCWLWRGTEIPEEWKEHNAYDYTKFTRLDHTKEQDRKLIEDYWTNVNESEGLVEGRPIFEAKWFK